MTTLKVSVPDKLYKRLQSKLARNGRSVEDLVLSWLRSVEDAQPISAQMEAKLLEGLRSPLMDADEIDWDEKIRRVRAMRKKGAA